jgi:tetratricopeptide (TPR) repeat protein
MASSLILNRRPRVPAEDSAAFGPIAERFRRAGDLERAVSLCREGLQKFPHHISARVTLGWALLDLGRYDEARTELVAVLRRAPDNLAAIRGLAELHDRAEHTLHLPMDGPGQWPPDEDTVNQAAEGQAESGEPVALIVDDPVELAEADLAPAPDEAAGSVVFTAASLASAVWAPVSDPGEEVAGPEPEAQAAAVAEAEAEAPVATEAAAVLAEPEAEAPVASEAAAVTAEPEAEAPVATEAAAVMAEPETEAPVATEAAAAMAEPEAEAPAAVGFAAIVAELEAENPAETALVQPEFETGIVSEGPAAVAEPEAAGNAAGEALAVAPEPEPEAPLVAASADAVSDESLEAVLGAMLMGASEDLTPEFELEPVETPVVSEAEIEALIAEANRLEAEADSADAQPAFDADRAPDLFEGLGEPVTPTAAGPEVGIAAEVESVVPVALAEVVLLPPARTDATRAQIAGLERFLRQVQARRAELMAQSVA